MSWARRILELARGDVLERVRRYSFLVTLGAAAYLAYTVHAGWWLVRVGDYAPATGFVRLGMLVGVATGTMLSLVGFYVVKGSVDRDRRTGVGPILAATPATRLHYAASKFLSNLAVFGAMLGVLVVLALAMAASRGGLGPADLPAVVAPTVLLAGPALVLVAGLAVLFDSVPWLRGTFGNGLYFFLWVGLLASALAGSPALDVTGFALVRDSLHQALAAAHPDATATGLTIQLRSGGLPDTAAFAWNGVSWTAGTLAWRLYWVAGGIVLAVLAALCLRLFDPFGDAVGAGMGRAEEDRTAAGPPEASASSPAAAPSPAGRASPHAAGGGFTGADLAPAGRAGPLESFLRTTGGELRLLLSGHAWWWYAGLAAANAAALFLPSGSVGTPLLVACLLPVSAWSSLGCRERAMGTEQLLFSSPGPRRRQLPAQMAAGVVLAVIAAVGPLLRWILVPEPASLAAVGSGALFVPALALAAGAWSGSSRLFEALYVVLWYVGPLNGVPFLDFMGATGEALAFGAPHRFLLAGVLLAALAWLGRGRRLRAVG